MLADYSAKKIISILIYCVFHDVEIRVADTAIVLLLVLSSALQSCHVFNILHLLYHNIVLKVGSSFVMLS